MKLFPVLALIATALLGRACFAQAVLPTELGGLRLPPAGSQSVDTNATFAVGLTTDGTTWRHGAGPADVIRVVGRVRPEAAQVGTRADLFLVVAVEGKFLMRSSNGAFLPWSGQMSDLLPFRTATLLTADTEVEWFSGALGSSGNFPLFVGYRGADGVLRYSQRPYVLAIAAAPSGGAPVPAPEGCLLQESRFPALLGKPLADVRAALLALPGISTVRSGGPNDPMTLDYRLDRATVLIQFDVATRITCG
jgi:hypothetical protein